MATMADVAAYLAANGITPHTANNTITWACRVGNEYITCVVSNGGDQDPNVQAMINLLRAAIHNPHPLSENWSVKWVNQQAQALGISPERIAASAKHPFWDIFWSLYSWGPICGTVATVGGWEVYILQESAVTVALYDLPHLPRGDDQGMSGDSPAGTWEAEERELPDRPAPIFWVNFCNNICWDRLGARCPVQFLFELCPVQIKMHSWSVQAAMIPEQSTTIDRISNATVYRTYIPILVSNVIGNTKCGANHQCPTAHTDRESAEELKFVYLASNDFELPDDEILFILLYLPGRDSSTTCSLLQFEAEEAIHVFLQKSVKTFVFACEHNYILFELVECSTGVVTHVKRSRSDFLSALALQMHVLLDRDGTNISLWWVMPQETGELFELLQERENLPPTYPQFPLIPYKPISACKNKE
ncbi:hypothetical protein EDD17DRAFT_1512976 [Pisolithus thermaeus]|nr:hypothetical protein EDD17DRAFT_1512976 [Pisolithus thermaeus]